MSNESNTIDRREAVRRVGLLLGGVTFIGGSGLLEACMRERKTVAAGQNVGDFTASDVAFLDEVADTILPTTSTPGAKAAKTGAFMAVMVTDSYYPDDQKTFREGMRKLDAASQKKNGASFMQATPEQRLALLKDLDKEAKDYTDAVNRAKERKAKGDTTHVDEAVLAGEQRNKTEGAQTQAITADSPPHYFRMMKELAMLGYFTSEIGMTQAQRYQETPGRYDPCLPYTKGEKAWANHA